MNRMIRLIAAALVVSSCLATAALACPEGYIRCGTSSCCTN